MIGSTNIFLDALTRFSCVADAMSEKDFGNAANKEAK